jgi:hypothetical protein
MDELEHIFNVILTQYSKKEAILSFECVYVYSLANPNPDPNERDSHRPMRSRIAPASLPTYLLLLYLRKHVP